MEGNDNRCIELWIFKAQRIRTDLQRTIVTGAMSLPGQVE